MTLKTWKEEFYPVRPTKKMSKREAIEHSLQKWIGLRKANLKKHSVWIGFLGALFEDEVVYSSLKIDSSSCALCKKYYIDRDETNDGVGCPECPLQNVLGTTCDGSSTSPYGKWTKSHDPEPMIRSLKRALKEVEDEE